MRLVSFTASVVLTLAAVLTACSDSPAPSSTCASTRECPFGQLCSVQTHQCVPEPAQGVFGRFSCTTHASAPQMEVGGTDVVANLDGHRYVLATGTTCLITDHYLVLTVQQVTGDLTDHQLALVVDIAKIAPGAPYQLFDTQSTQPYAIVDSGALTRGANFDVIGVITGGSLTFDQVPQLEQTLSGTIDAGLRVYTPPATVVCDDGLSGHADCNRCLDDANAPGGCCEAQIQACADSTACSELVSCYGGCAGDDACLDGCYATHADGTPIFKAWSWCETGDASAGTVGACGTLCNQASCPSNPDVSACLACVKAQCCASLSACVDDAECTAYLDCALECTTDACADGCATSHPTGAQTYLPYSDCAASKCASSCG